jgi:hypothetical protein
VRQSQAGAIQPVEVVVREEFGNHWMGWMIGPNHVIEFAGFWARPATVADAADGGAGGFLEERFGAVHPMISEFFTDDEVDLCFAPSARSSFLTSSSCQRDCRAVTSFTITCIASGSRLSCGTWAFRYISHVSRHCSTESC